MPKTLLLADDSVVIQKLVALSFANEDVNLVTVYNGDEAVEKARECRPDAVLADVVMPGKNGYEVCEAIRQDPTLAHVPVLLLTGTFEAFDEERANQAGSNGHITKPFEAQALVDRVNALLASTSAPETSAAPLATDAAAAPSSDEAFDFFDEEMPATSMSEEVPSAEVVSEPAEDVFEFGGGDAPELEPLSAEDADDLDLDLGGDRTVAMMDDTPSLDMGSDPLVGMSDSVDEPGDRTVTASGLAGSPDDSADVSFGSKVTSPDVGATDLSATVLADDAFESAAPAEADAPSVSAAGLTSDPEDFFASDPGASLGAPEMEPDLEFSFDGGTAPSAEIPPELDLASDAGLAPPLPEAELDPAGSSAYDVSISDLGDSFALDMASTGHATPPPLPTATTASVADELTGAPSFAPAQAEAEAEAEVFETAEVAEVEPIESEVVASIETEARTPLDAQAEVVSIPPAVDLPRPEQSAGDHAWPVEESPDPELPNSEIDPFEDSFSARPSLSNSSSALDPVLEAGPTFAGSDDLDETDDDFAPVREIEPIPATAAGSHLSDVMRDRVHETLEKVAWEAFADLSDTIVRQVLERVEQVAWEVIPQMAETLIQDEIRKIKGDDEA